MGRGRQREKREMNAREREGEGKKERKMGGGGEREKERKKHLPLYYILYSQHRIYSCLLILNMTNSLRRHESSVGAFVEVEV